MPARRNPTSLVCKHGLLRRSCGHCESEDEIEELELLAMNRATEIERLEREVVRLTRNFNHAIEGKREQEKRKKDATRQLAALTAEVDRLKKLEAAVRDIELTITVATECGDPLHDIRHCSTCEVRELGIDDYQAKLLTYLEEPPCPTT